MNLQTTAQDLSLGITSLNAMFSTNFGRETEDNNTAAKLLIDSYVRELSKEQYYLVIPTADIVLRIFQNDDVKAPELPLSAVSIRDIIAEIDDVLGLNNTLIADIIGVSRISVSKHKGGCNPDESTLESYRRLYELAQIAKIYRTTLAPGLKSVLIDRRSLLRHLQESWRDPEKMGPIFELVAKKLDGRKSELEITNVELKKAIRVLTKEG